MAGAYTNAMFWIAKEVIKENGYIWLISNGSDKLRQFLTQVNDMHTNLLSDVMYDASLHWTMRLTVFLYILHVYGVVIIRISLTVQNLLDCIAFVH
jgi:hypothetical protein